MEEHELVIKLRNTRTLISTENMSETTSINCDFLFVLFSLTSKKLRQAVLEVLSPAQLDRLNDLFFELVNCRDFARAVRTRLRGHRNCVTSLRCVRPHRNTINSDNRRIQKHTLDILKSMTPYSTIVLDYLTRYGQ